MGCPTGFMSQSSQNGSKLLGNLQDALTHASMLGQSLCSFLVMFHTVILVANFWV